MVAEKKLHHVSLSYNELFEKKDEYISRSVLTPPSMRKDIKEFSLKKENSSFESTKKEDTKPKKEKEIKDDTIVDKKKTKATGGGKESKRKDETNNKNVFTITNKHNKVISSILEPKEKELGEMEDTYKNFKKGKSIAETPTSGNTKDGKSKINKNDNDDDDDDKNNKSSANAKINDMKKRKKEKPRNGEDLSFEEKRIIFEAVSIGEENEEEERELYSETKHQEEVKKTTTDTDTNTNTMTTENRENESITNRMKLMEDKKNAVKARRSIGEETSVTFSFLKIVDLVNKYKVAALGLTFCFLPLLIPLLLIFAIFGIFVSPMAVVFGVFYYAYRKWTSENVIIDSRTHLK